MVADSGGSLTNHFSLSARSTIYRLMPLQPAHPSWLLCGALGGYLLVMFTNPARASLRDGLRAIRRYSMLWLPLGVFGFAYALFELALRIYFFCVLPPESRPVFEWWRAASPWMLPWRGLARSAVLPALENVAGIFGNLVSTFPLAAVAAVLLLVNWDGHHGVLWRALRKRFGIGAVAVWAGIFVCALAAIAKPFLYVIARQVDGALWYQWSPVVVWLAFLFEYLFGVCIQLWLILLAYCWVRGRNITQRDLLDFAIRRFSFVVKWAALAMLLSSVFIDLPLILKNFAPFTRWFPNDGATIEHRLAIARAIITAFLLAFSTVQITLVFHSETLRRALRHHAEFLRAHWWPFAWFLLIAALHLYLLHVVNFALRTGLGEGTAPGLAWQLAFPWVAAVVAAWLLASWVCLYQRCDAGRSASESWIDSR